MKLVYICSRYRADERHTVEENIGRALYACSVALSKGYAPFAPHLIYPRVLDDNDPEDRQLGMKAALNWLIGCEELWQWGATVSEGMALEIEIAQKAGIPVKVFNSIGIPKEHWNSEKAKNGGA